MGKRKMLRRRIETLETYLRFVEDRGPMVNILEGEKRRPVRKETKQIAREYRAARYRDFEAEVEVARRNLAKARRRWKKKYG